MLNRPEPWPAVAPVHHCGRVRVVSQNLPPPLATQRADRVQLRERAKTQTLTAKNQNTNVKSIEYMPCQNALCVGYVTVHQTKH